MRASENNAMLLLGAGGHARACIDVIEQAGGFAIAGLVGLPEEVGKSVLGYPVLGSDADLQALLAQYPYAVVAMGQSRVSSHDFVFIRSLSNIASVPRPLFLREPTCLRMQA